MDIKEYISSGILELYVYGALPEDESREVAKVLRKHPEIRKEVEEIENALLKLSSSGAPYNPQALLSRIKEKMSQKESSKVVVMEKDSTTPWISYIGWAASIALMIGIFFLFKSNFQLREQLSAERVRSIQLEQQIADIRNEAENTEELLAVLRNKNIRRVPLAGQSAAPEAFAAVYWNKQENKAYIDAKELPTPPRGKVYQVWSLKLDPLSPTSIGLLADYEVDDNLIFELENANESQAFGITLEPEGGSESPTMDQLYVLGAVSSP